MYRSDGIWSICSYDMRLTLRFDVFLVSHSPTPTQNSIERSDQSVNRQVGLRRRVEVRRCHGEVSYGWRSSTTGKHVWRPLPTSPVHAHRVASVSPVTHSINPSIRSDGRTVAAGRRGAPSARLTSRPEPLALRMSYYGSRAPSQAISGLGVSVKFRVMWFGLT